MDLEKIEKLIAPENTYELSELAASRQGPWESTATRPAKRRSRAAPEFVVLPSIARRCPPHRRLSAPTPQAEPAVFQIEHEGINLTPSSVDL